MTDYEFPKTPKVEEAYRTAYRALAALVPPRTVTPEGESDFAEVLSQFRILVDKAEFAVAAQLGPRISWRAPRRDGDWEMVLSGVDLDCETVLCVARVRCDPDLDWPCGCLVVDLSAGSGDMSEGGAPGRAVTL